MPSLRSICHAPPAPRWTDAENECGGERKAHLLLPPGDAARLTAPMMLRDGVALIVRATRPDDTQRPRAFHPRLSLQTIYLRFFTLLPTPPLDMAERLTHVDNKNRIALEATTGAGTGEQIVAGVRYERSVPTAGEVAVVAEGYLQGRGIASALLCRLVEHARGRGFVEFVAQSIGWTTRMHSLLRHCGFRAVSYVVNDMTAVRLVISRPPAAAGAR